MSRRTYEEGLALAREHRKSGLSQTEYARQNRINVAALRYWIRRTQKGSGLKSPVQFVELAPLREDEAASWVTIETPTGLVVRMEPRPPAGFLSELLRGLQQG